ncbi:OmpA family protein [Nocardiopsis sp. LOL_012]|uniref:OmpA family protein n=1 Tax=Nocardiopsis sp. LOL_012 TaxID=3345409 RepID=UPI003A841E1A
MRKTSAIALAAAVLFGIPYLLLWHLSWPQLDLSWSGVLVHLRALRMPPGLPTVLLIVALWTLWGLYLAGILAEAVARLRGTVGPLRPLGPLQVVAATAVGATLAAPTQAMADTVVQDGEETERGDEAAPPAPDEAPREQRAERERVVSGFATGSAELTDAMRQDLAPVVDLLLSYGDPSVPVHITGHTDPSGDVQTNLRLSQLRAQAVADHLADELRAKAPDTVVTGVGSQEVREGGAADQRRVELTYSLRTGPLAGTPAPAEDADQAGETAQGTPGEEALEQVPVLSASAAEEDGEETAQVVVLEIPDTAPTLAAGFAGLLGGYVLSRGGVRVPRTILSLPRPRNPFPRKPTRHALPPAPPRPAPSEDIDDRVSVELGHVPGLGLTGAGAAGAARRLLFNALDTSGEDTARVVVTEADIEHLIGAKGRELLSRHPCEPLQMVGTTRQALEVLQNELRESAEEALTTDEPAPLVLVSRTPGPEHETALSALLLHGQHRGISAVILGRWPLGGSCVIEEDGLIVETSPPLNPIFHYSWPGCSADRVREAIRAYRHSRPVTDSRFQEEQEESAGFVFEDFDGFGEETETEERAAFSYDEPKRAVEPVASSSEAEQWDEREDEEPEEWREPERRPTAVELTEALAGSEWVPAPAPAAAGEETGAETRYYDSVEDHNEWVEEPEPPFSERAVWEAGESAVPEDTEPESERTRLPDRSEPPAKAGKRTRAPGRSGSRSVPAARPGNGGGRASGSGFWDTPGGSEDVEPNAFWGNVPEPGEPAPAAPRDTTPEDTAQTVPVAAPTRRKAAAPRNRTEASADLPKTPLRKRPGPVKSRRTAPAVRASDTAERASGPESAGQGGDGSGGNGGQPVSRPMPAKPRKAGRGRTWRPKEPV